MSYQIPPLGQFKGPSPARMERIDDAESIKLFRRWAQSRGQAIDLGSLLKGINPWKSDAPRGIDSFSGMGGFSAGATMAGINVVWAANHWKQAVDMYRQNHPWVDAQFENIAVPSWDWRKVPHHQIHMASPSCKGHTRALGAQGDNNKKLYDALRSTARAVLEAAEVHLPDVIVVENVPEFRNWGAKQADGRLYQAWLATLRAMDYQVTENVLNAADSGAACSRVRLFVVATQGKEPIHIPQDTQPWSPIEPLIDWSDEVHGEGSWSPLHPRDRREPLESWITDLIKRGGRAGMQRGIIPYFGTTKNKPLPLSVDAPIGSPGTKSTFGIYDLSGRGRYRMLRAEELKDAMGFPSHFQLPRKRNGRIHITQSNVMLANGVSPLCAAHVFRTVRKAMEAT